MKGRYTNKRQIILNFFSMKFCVDLEKHIVRNILYLNYGTSWQKIWLYRGGFVGSILMDLSKPYECLTCDILLAKLTVKLTVKLN